VLAYFGEDIDAAIELLDRALAINPSFARGWVTSGWLRLWAGQPESAISHFETSLRLSPQDRRAGTFMAMGVGHFFARRFDEAVAMLLVASGALWLGPHISVPSSLLCAYGAAGRGERDHQAAPGRHTRRGAGRYALAKPGTPRAIPFRSAAGCW